MKTLAEKVLEMGGELAPPASLSEISQLESRLGISLPSALSDLLFQHNGSLNETDEAIWRFWPCSEITSYQEFADCDHFCPDNNYLRELDPTARAVTIPASKLILFADALIDAPTYGVFHDLGHQFDGVVFDISFGSVSARCFGDWISAFIGHGEDGLLMLDKPKPEQAESLKPCPRRVGRTFLIHIFIPR